MNFDPAHLIVGFLFSSVGYIYFSYGKRQTNPPVMICGVVLMIYVYFVESLPAEIGLGAVLTALPFLLRWW